MSINWQKKMTHTPKNANSKKNDLLFGSYSHETKQIELLISKNFLIIDATTNAFRFFNQTQEKLLNSSVLKQLSQLDPKCDFNINNNTSFTLKKGSKKYIVSKTAFSMYFLISISPANDAFTLLRSYVASIINNLPGAVYWKDLEGRYMGCNKFVAKMAGYNNPEDMIGKTDYELCWKEFAEEWRNLDKQVITNNEALIREEHAKLADGRTITELTFKTPLKNEYNETIGIIGTSLDISELKQTQNDLQKAKEAAEAADIAKTQFIANMSHDIRTPLSGVVGLGSIVEKEIVNPEQRAKVHDMVKSADELLNMLNEILDVVSLGSVTIDDIHTEPFDLPHLVQTIVDLEQSSVDLKNITLIQSVDKNIPPILLGDHKKIHHILLNLVGNAIKFTKVGEVTISITLSQAWPDKVQLLFAVTDTGIGIPPESLDKVFELFYKVTPSYKGIDKGHGVGLHIVKTYTELLGGKVSVESQLNQGSTFSFSLQLPIADNHAHPKNIIQATLTERSEEPPILTQAVTNTDYFPNAPEILIIEDNAVARIVTQTLVTQMHWNATTAQDAETALELVKTKKFDLILSDIGLPGMSGIEFAQQLRQFEQQAHSAPVPIVAITGHAEGKLHAECLAAGINHVILKPIRPELLTEIGMTFSLLHEHTNTPIVTTPPNNTLSGDLPDTEAAFFQLDHHLLFDTEHAKKILGNNTNLLMTMLKDTIHSDIPKELERLRAAHAENNWQTIAKIAHKLKGGLVSISLNRAAIACKYLERYYKSGDTKLLEQLYQQVLEILELTMNSLKAFVK